METVKQLLEAGAAALAATSREARRDAGALLAHVLGRDRAWMLAHPAEPVAAEPRMAYDALLVRRAQHEPMQYILGEQEFCGLRFRVTPAVLIPRPETEHLVEAVLERLPRDRAVSVADVGTGSGVIAVALAHALPLAQVVALDVSPQALQIATGNVEALGVAARVRLLHSDLLSAVRGERFDCIVSNPPYIPASDLLEPQVAAWEPHSALFAGAAGLDMYERLLPEAQAALLPGGLLAMEIGYGQQAAIEVLFAQSGAWTGVAFLPDLQGIARVALARTVVREDAAR